VSAENKTIARRFYEEVWSKGNLGALDELMATNIVDHHTLPGLPPGLEGFKQVLTMFRTAFPDLHLTVEDMIAEGDMVVSRVKVRGTHKGDLMGIAPTGKQVTLEAIDITRIAGDKFVERWGIIDMLGMMQQLGVIPAPG